jgi:hypothetical protein
MHLCRVDSTSIQDYKWPKLFSNDGRMQDNGTFYFGNNLNELPSHVILVMPPKSTKRSQFLLIFVTASSSGSPFLPVFVSDLK